MPTSEEGADRPGRAAAPMPAREETLVGACRRGRLNEGASRRTLEARLGAAAETGAGLVEVAAERAVWSVATVESDTDVAPPPRHGEGRGQDRRRRRGPGQDPALR